jgi:hypothetical protein
MPLTLARLGAVLLLLAVWGRRIARGRRASADVQAFAGARRAWRLAVAVVLAWVGLTVAVAVSFSAM